MINTDLPEPMRQRFALLMQQLRELTAGKKVYYQPNRGNWGDGLIMAGTRRFLADAGIQYTERFYRRLRSPRSLRKPLWLHAARLQDSVLIYGGGGAMCSLWDVTGYVNYVSRHFRHTVILPSTFERQPEIASVTLYCRDCHASQALTGGQFVDDMAFYLGRRHMAPGSGTGYFFRTDKDAAGKMEIPAGNLDLSLARNYKYPVEDFFATLAGFSEIHTDRLHVAIASCLLGKRLYLYPGSYFKNEAVFRSSMLGLFPQAVFVN
jgi:exopolysaccharide biosynthesis predicted pyruvyltransferase EpsI